MKATDMTNKGIAAHLEQMTHSGLFQQVAPAARAIFKEAIERLRGNSQTLTLSVDAASIAGRFNGVERVVLDVMAERDRQDAQWGGPVHDDTHNVFDWTRYIEQQIAKLGDLPEGQLPTPEDARFRLVKIAALAFAAIESHDREYPLTDDTEPQPADPVASFQPYEDRAGEFRWRFVAVNGRIMADSAEGYSTAYNVRRAIEDFRALVADATVEGA